YFSFSLTTPPPPSSTLFPYTTLFRSQSQCHPTSSSSEKTTSSCSKEACPEILHGSRRRTAAPLADPERKFQTTVNPRKVQKPVRSEEHTSELQSPCNLVCRLLLEKKK